MLEDEEFAMRKQTLALLAACAAALAVTAGSLPVEARPLGGGWSGGRPVAHSGGPWFKGSHPGRRSGFKGGRFVAAEIGPGGGRYLSDSAWFLSDFGGYLADDQAYAEAWSDSYGYAYPAYSGPVSYGYRPSASYAVPVYRSHARRRMVTVHRGPPGRAIHRAAFRSGRHLGR
jgi:hypothetical protein